MRKTILILFFLATTFFSFAQQDNFNTQYFVNELGINPAVAGSKSYNPLVIITRQQWLGFQGAPISANISYHGALNNRSGLGGSLYHYQTAEVGNSVFELDYSYHLPLDKDRINLAFGIGIKSIYYTLDLQAGNLPPGEDPAFTSNTYSRFLADVSSGFYLYGSNFYAGYSALNIMQSNFSKESGDGFSKNYLYRNYIGILGYKYGFNRDISIEPSLLLRKTEITSMEYDFSTRVFIKNQFWTGLGYRTNKSMCVILGFRYGKIHFTYSYDHYFNDINAYQNGTHELSISFQLQSILNQRHINFWDY